MDKNKRLTDQEVESKVTQLTGWALENNTLTRTFTFAGFPEAIAFVLRLAFDAEAADHHPDLTINYKRVRVVWSTHSAGGITDKDFAGVAQCDAIALQFAAR